MKNLSESLAEKPLLTSHSFIIGFIKQLRRCSNDIEFVRQAIGHRKIDSTLFYIQILPESELKEKMSQLN